MDEEKEKEKDEIDRAELRITRLLAAKEEEEEEEERAVWAKGRDCNPAQKLNP